MEVVTREIGDVAVETIAMPRHEARRAFKDYADAVRAKNEKALTKLEAAQQREDEELMACYRWLSRNDYPLINIVTALTSTGTDDLDRPLLAVARADWRKVRFERDYGRYKPRGSVEGELGYQVFYFHEEGAWNPTSKHDKSNVVVPVDAMLRMGVKRDTRCIAVVPTIPIHLRPNKLKDYHILWEADWDDVPDDPLLLRRVGRWHFAVVAQWDLTPLEQSVLASSRMP